jgi:pimeloyl-ACP methyl ester carboxylesterase
VRFAEALARTGVVVLVPESSNLLAGRILPGETDALQQSFLLLARQPDVDPNRIGFVGFSIGGGLSIVAAAQPALRDRVRFVNSLGGYFDAPLLLIDVASRSILVNGRSQSWQPSALTLEVLATQLIGTLPDGPDRDLLERAYVRHEAVSAAEWELLSPEARAVRRLLDGVSRPEAETLVASLPESSRQQLRAVSPSVALPQLSARLYLMHDTADSYIPFSHSRALAANAPRGVLQRFTEFSIFQHVIPDKPVPLDTFVPDVWGLYWHMHAVLMEVL